MVKLDAIFERKVAAVYGLAQYYAQAALNDFRQKQANNYYWNNQTGQARDRMRTEAFREGGAVGFVMYHGVDYGLELELANDRRHAAIEPTVSHFAPLFVKAAKEIL